MRISDWSSDVCSSDLVDLRIAAPLQPPLPHPIFNFLQGRARQFAQIAPPRPHELHSRRILAIVMCPEGGRQRPCLGPTDAGGRLPPIGTPRTPHPLYGGQPVSTPAHLTLRSHTIAPQPPDRKSVT